MGKIKVLVFPAGEVNSAELHDALSTCVNIEVWGASSIERHGSYIFSNYVSGLPFIHEPNFIHQLNLLIEEKKIDVIFPTHDTVANFFSHNQKKIKSKIVVADQRTTAICRDKYKTYVLFSDCDFVPIVYENFECFPVFIKPREGQGSVGAKIAYTVADLASIKLDEYVICEYLPGEEFTVDCFTDNRGRLCFVSPRSRLRTMAGISVAGKTEKLTAEINNIANVINKRLSFLGLWWFQIKKDKRGKWKLLEISTRCAGAMCLTRMRGINLPLLSVYTVMGYEVQFIWNDYTVEMDRTFISRFKLNYYYEIVYIDFDDTIIVNKNVNLKAIWFLYQCKNYNKKIILLTRHEHEITNTLKRYAISDDLFSKIILVKTGEEKYNYINPDKSIFIDNSFHERLSVYNKFKIPVFDVDAIDLLMDWRM